MLPFIAASKPVPLWPVSMLNSSSLSGGGGVPESIIVEGVTYFLLRDDDTNEILRDDETTEPLYDEAA